MQMRSLTPTNNENSEEQIVIAPAKQVNETPSEHAHESHEKQTADHNQPANKMPILTLFLEYLVSPFVKVFMAAATLFPTAFYFVPSRLIDKLLSNVDYLQFAVGWTSVVILCSFIALIWTNNVHKSQSKMAYFLLFLALSTSCMVSGRVGLAAMKSAWELGKLQETIEDLRIKTNTNIQSLDQERSSRLELEANLKSTKSALNELSQQCQAAVAPKVSK
jgi:hypothetical protein